METEQTEEKMIQPKILEEKVALTKESADKLQVWISFVQEKKKGTLLTKKGLVNWLISQLPEMPTKAESTQLIEKFYDEERYYRVLLKEAKERKLAQGGQPTPSDLEDADI